RMGGEPFCGRPGGHTFGRRELRPSSRGGAADPASGERCGDGRGDRPGGCRPSRRGVLVPGLREVHRHGGAAAARSDPRGERLRLAAQVRVTMSVARAARVSVVLPVYDREAYVGEAIESVLAQTLPPDELIVVDDGSTDASLAVVESFARPCLHVIRQANGG